MTHAVRITVDDREAREVLEGIDERMLKGMALLFRGPIHQLITEFFQKQFDSEGVYGGTPWNPLSPVTLAFKAKYHRENMGILRFTNRLWASLTKISGPDMMIEVTNSSYTRSTRVPYALQHQEGWQSSSIFGRPRKVTVQIPPRPIVPEALPEQDEAEIDSMVERFVETGEID